MRKAYYYFSTSLPSICFEDMPPMTIRKFMEDCQRLLWEKDYAHVYQLIIENGEGVQSNNNVINAWIKFEQEFRNEIARYRAEKANKDPQDHMRGGMGSTPYLVEIINEAGKMTNLIEAEKLLDKTRWEYLDELVSGHYFDFEYVLIYGLKLRILERYTIINSSKGKELFNEIKKCEFS